MAKHCIAFINLIVIVRNDISDVNTWTSKRKSLFAMGRCLLYAMAW